MPQFILAENIIDINDGITVYISPPTPLYNDLVSAGQPRPINTRYNVNLYVAASPGSYIQVPLHMLRNDNDSFTYQNADYVESLNIRPMFPLSQDMDYILEFKNINDQPREIFKIRAVMQHKTRNPNDIHYQLQNLDNLANGESILYGLDYTNYNVNPVAYNSNLNKYVGETDQYGRTVILTEDNAKNIKELFLKTYMLEYQNYFTDINNRNDPSISSPFALKYTDKQINDLNLFIIKNITKYNSIKGTKLLMEFIMSLYANILGYSLVSIVEDPAHACIYRITSSIPRDFWLRNIKPIVHPCGWSDIYSEINSINKGPWQTKIQEPDRMRLLFNMYSKSYLDEHHYVHTQRKHNNRELQRILHSTGVIQPYNAVVHGQVGHEYCGYLNQYDQYKFNITFSGHSASTAQVSGANNFFYDLPPATGVELLTSGFSSNGVWYSSPVYYDFDNDISAWRPVPVVTLDTITLKEELTADHNFNFTIDQRKIYEDKENRIFEFKLPGIALDYIYVISRDNSIIQTTNNLHSIFDKDMHDIPFASTSFFRAKETIRRDDWYYYIHEYDDFYQLGYKNVLEKFQLTGRDQQYIGWLNNSGESFNDNRNLAELSTHHIKTLSGISINAMAYDIDAITDDIAILQAPDNFSIDLTPINNTDSRYTIEYKMPGIAEKYIWSVYRSTPINWTDVTSDAFWDNYSGYTAASFLNGVWESDPSNGEVWLEPKGTWHVGKFVKSIKIEYEEIVAGVPTGATTTGFMARTADGLNTYDPDWSGNTDYNSDNIHHPYVNTLVPNDGQFAQLDIWLPAPGILKVNKIYVELIDYSEVENITLTPPVIIDVEETFHPVFSYAKKTADIMDYIFKLQLAVADTIIDLDHEITSP